MYFLCTDCLEKILTIYAWADLLPRWNCFVYVNRLWCIDCHPRYRSPDLVHTNRHRESATSFFIRHQYTQKATSNFQRLSFRQISKIDKPEDQYSKQNCPPPALYPHFGDRPTGQHCWKQYFSENNKNYKKVLKYNKVEITNNTTIHSKQVFNKNDNVRFLNFQKDRLP